MLATVVLMHESEYAFLKTFLLNVMANFLYETHLQEIRNHDSIYQNISIQSMMMNTTKMILCRCI